MRCHRLVSKSAPVSLLCLHYHPGLEAMLSKWVDSGLDLLPGQSIGWVPWLRRVSDRASRCVSLEASCAHQLDRAADLLPYSYGLHSYLCSPARLPVQVGLEAVLSALMG